MAFPTLLGAAPEGSLMREPQACLGSSLAFANYQFFLTGTTTPANVFQDGNLTTAFPNTGVVGSDAAGRFPPIYLDPSIVYKVVFSAPNGVTWTRDPYVSPLSTRGTSQNTSYGMQIAPTGEVTIPAPNSGGTAINLLLKSGVLGTAALKLQGVVAGNPVIIVNSSATTGAQTAVFIAINKPGTSNQSTFALTTTVAPSGATYTGGNLTANFTGVSAPTYTIGLSTGQFITGCTFTNGSAVFTCPSTNITGTPTTAIQVGVGPGGGIPGAVAVTPAGWLPVQADGVVYYVPIWHGNNFTPYAPNPTAVGETIAAASVVFGGNGITTPTSGTAVPGNWFTPTSANIGGSYWINITRTGGLSGLSFSAAQGSWTNITNGGLTIAQNTPSFATVSGTYQLSTSASGSPVVASGTIALTGTTGITNTNYNVATPLNLATNGTATDGNNVAQINWYSPTTASIGNNYWISVSQTGGTAGYSFTGISQTPSAPTAMSSALALGISGPAGSTFSVSGTYTISTDSGGVNVVGTGTVTLTGGTNVQSNNYTVSSGGTFTLNGNGSTSLGTSQANSWYFPNTTNIGSGYWIDITRTGGTSGVNFSAAQGSYANITNSGLTIGLSGTSGLVGTATASGTYVISNSNGGVTLGSGSISISITGLTLLHVYTSGSNVTETIPSGTTTVKMEGWAGGGGGGGANGGGSGGAGGGAGGYSRVSMTASSLGGTGKTFKYTVGSGGSGGSSGGGVAGTGGTSTITAGTVTGFSTITCNGGVGGTGNGGAAGAGGTATNANSGAVNTTGASGGASSGASPGSGGAGTSGNVSGDGSPYGAGGSGKNGNLTGAGAAGSGGAVVFFYT